MQPSFSYAFAALLGTLQCVLGQNIDASPQLLAELDYGTFQGAYSKEFNISYWQKIPFAAPPIGVNRFRGPQPPIPVTESPYNSSQFFDMCPQRTVNGSEDCLYLGLYSRPWTEDQPLKPVIVTFYGGGFVQGSGYFTLPPTGFPYNTNVPPPSDMIFAYPTLNVSSASDMVIVYPNYRTNAFGFLPGKLIDEDPFSDLNPGLLDQEAALKWTKTNIAKFGGNPDDITIWGQSAGGGSVLAQTIGRSGKKNLFRRAMANSPFWPKVYHYDSPEAEALYDELVNRTGCAGPDSLSCLKGLEVQTIRDASLKISGLLKYTTSYFNWAPVIDGKFLTESLTEATSSIKIERAFAMHNTHEGESFIPASLQGAANETAFDKWLRGFLPNLSECEIAAVKKHYPAEGATETIDYDSTWVRAGLVYRDNVLSCPAYWFTNAASQGYFGEYSLTPSLHASDTFWWNRINATQLRRPSYYRGYAGAIASFLMKGNPNELKLTPEDVASVPIVQDGSEWVINGNGFDTADAKRLASRCAFWRKTSARVPV
ncbi:hypothetical protein VD0002_g4773 [Verticillium dahliae]|uniref:Carboxylic ester hydrolase n=2 Tax=Verticillium dahliae TaxID=27337 RepID=G2X6G9_VERDV|nr:acetylcholinesterase [Verticillium dahliae VdLs.17]KAF3345762.1 hypothetical protein VdG2_05998 [Verticillium dahliae VDG2]KAH6708368.1 acetylcholinesterase [Verticillium dahliae]EGY14587.1 acetylcholinesterase [Verticillium dahliae VdLs.17]PNH35121.1 hypothetical protein BJF96_g1815 [Verticillium dahliae]PNH53919.1 hypothetical protein VD0003_g3515 [Verticillium dahliae]